MRKLKFGFVLALSLLAIACTEQDHSEDLQPINMAPGEVPVLGEIGNPVTYITIEFGELINREAFYLNYRSRIRILSSNDCLSNDDFVVWEVPEITVEEFEELFREYLPYAPTASNTHAKDPYAVPPPPLGEVYVYYGNFCEQ